jgi:hypothetical protein
VKTSLGVLLVLTLLAFPSFAQTRTAEKKKALQPKSPELSLRIVPDKGTYVLREKVFTKTEFVNRTDKTLCFPEPSLDGQDEASGYLTMRVVSLNPDGSSIGNDQFLEHFPGGMAWPREKLLSEIEERWIKLAPNQVYVAKSRTANLSSTGKWQLSAIYNPPECPFNIAECTLYVKSAAQSVGCVVPEMVVTSPSAAINVVAPPE